MKVSVNAIKNLIRSLGYNPEDGCSDIYYKIYSKHDNYIIRVNFGTSNIEYRNEKVSEENGIKWGDLTTCNFENSENFVVLECVDRLLEKGYPPNSIILEHKYPLGRELKGKLDVIVFDDSGSPYLMIECKTWGTEYEKELRKMIRDGGQLFSYYVQDKATKYLCLYTSQLNEDKIEYRTEIVKVDEAWLELSNKKEIHDHWNKNFKNNGIFEEWANPYNVEIKALVRGRLKELTQEDSGRIFNQFAEILRHNVVSDKPNAFNKILNLFICKIYDENKNDDEEVEFQWLENDTDESLQNRLNDLYKNGMYEFLDIDVTDYSEEDIDSKLTNIEDKSTLEEIKKMFLKLRLQKNSEFAFIEVYDDQSFKSNARVVREVVELLQPYQFRYGHKQQFLGDFFELLLNTSIKQESGQYFTPVPITRFIVSSLPVKEFILNKIKNNETQILPTVIDYATGSGHFLTEYMDQVQNILENIDVSKAKPSARNNVNIWKSEFGKFQWAKEYVYGIEADYRLVKTTKVSAFLNGDGDANIIRANGLDNFQKSKDFKLRLKETSNDDPKDNAQFDILIANPPYSVNSFKSTLQYGEDSFELYNYLTDNSSEIECLFVERAKQLLKVGGFAGIILPITILTNTGIYTATREILLKYFRIKAIVELGSNTFMATTTITVILFLERRQNNEWEMIKSAINSFFERPKDVTILGIENVFSKYVNEVFREISFEDYVSFVLRKPNNNFRNTGLYKDYQNWFNNLTEIVNLKNKKAFKNLDKETQNQKLEKLFYDKVIEIEKEKILYFLLTYQQKTVIIQVGEKQAEKEFIGYEFSKRRGHEGIRMLPGGTKLYDENNSMNPKKANSYIYNAFLNNEINIDESMKKNISCIDTYQLLDFDKVNFEKIINLNSKKKIKIETKWETEKLGKIIKVIKGVTYSKKDQVYKATPNIILTADNITLDNCLDIVKKVYLKNDFNINSTAKLIKNDIFICFSSGSRKHVGKVAFIENNTEYFAGGFMGILRSKSDNINMKYLYLMLSSPSIQENIKLEGKGANIKNLNEEIKSIDIPLPPIEIQKQIVNEINNIDLKIKDNKNKIIILKDSILNPKYFSYPQERIEKITTMVQRGKTAKYGKSNIQIIKSGQARGYNEFDFTHKYYVSKNFISDERNLIKGDILINSTGVGTAGRVTLFDLDGDFVVDSHITIVRLDKSKALPKYILYALANIGFKNIEKMATGQSGQVELSYQIINNIKIPLPPIDEQQKITSEIEVIESQIQELKKEIANAEESKKQVLLNFLK